MILRTPTTVAVLTTMALTITATDADAYAGELLAEMKAKGE